MTNEEMVMAKIERDIERLEDELLHEDFDLMELRDNDTTIHWTLCALSAYMKDLQKAGLWADEVPEPVEELTFNLESTINIRVYEITGFDTSNFAGNEYDSDENKNGYPKLTLVDDIVQMAQLG